MVSTNSASSGVPPAATMSVRCCLTEYFSTQYCLSWEYLLLYLVWLSSTKVCQFLRFSRWQSWL